MIQAQNVCKTYKKNQINILNNISFSIKKGEITAILGHNGSGKSTLLKCMIGILKPTSGSITIDGMDSFKYQKKLRTEIGVIFNQKPSFIVDLDVIDNLLFFKEIYEISDEEYKNNLELIDSFLNIKGLYNKPYRKLSFGERVKCEIASVLLHNPKYIFLDEPTIGLDYTAKKGLYALLQYLNSSFDSTIVVITHEIDYIQSICNHVIILSNGKIKYNGTPDKVKNAIKHKYSVTIKYASIIDSSKYDDLQKLAEKNEDNTMTFLCHSEKKLQELQRIVLSSVSLIQFQCEEPTIKEVFENVLQEIT
ncbi:MAG: ABC transporter ATP-binding protein [Eubacterium sp.]|nr:ABC transporter ATP-binding protein [Eubacterium sp.]